MFKKDRTNDFVVLYNTAAETIFCAPVGKIRGAIIEDGGSMRIDLGAGVVYRLYKTLHKIHSMEGLMNSLALQLCNKKNWK